MSTQIEFSILDQVFISSRFSAQRPEPGRGIYPEVARGIAACMLLGEATLRLSVSAWLRPHRKLSEISGPDFYSSDDLDP